MPSTIELTGQIITYVDYFRNPKTMEPFYFSHKNVIGAANAFLKAGITKIEVPSDVLNPVDIVPTKEGLEHLSFQSLVEGMPKGIQVIATYIGSEGIENKDEFVKRAKDKINELFHAFPHMKYIEMHPHERNQMVRISDVVDAWSGLADYAANKREGAQVCFHNHHDTGGESIDEVRLYLQNIKKTDNPALRWGVDIGHLHSVGEAEYILILEDFADLIGNYFHIKTWAPALDKTCPEYMPELDITDGRVDHGFVNPSDPLVRTNLAWVFEKIRSLTPSRTIYGALEIDIPRIHPLGEIRDATIYLTQVHGLETGKNLSLEELARIR